MLLWLRVAPNPVLDPKNLLPAVDWRERELFLELAKRFYATTGLGLKVRGGRRTCEEQNAIYAKGRTTYIGQKPETYARGCQSWHVMGRAIDADPVDLATGKVHASCANATAAGVLWEQLGGFWGGRFSGFGECGDQGHFQYTKGVSMAQACPSPDACEQAVSVIQTVKPGSGSSTVLWALAGAGVVGVAAWFVLR